MQESDHLMVKQQYEEMPYPNVPISVSMKHELNEMFLSSIVNGFYHRSQRVLQPKDKWILDVGCGSGVTSLKLADANPEATIVGIDLSPVSLAYAKDRLTYHGHNSAQFYEMPIEDLPKLQQKIGISFDYINCDEMLYFMDDTLSGLTAMKSVLHGQGIIRANLHSDFQRHRHFRAQKLWKFLGLMDDCSMEVAIASVRQIMESLSDLVDLKSELWSSVSKSDEEIGMNFLLRGDRGFTIPNTFDLLESAGLKFIKMVNWQFWDLDMLFSKQMPEELELMLGMASEQEKLHLFELFHPTHRLIDFWCGHEDVEITYQSPLTWQDKQWEKSQIYLHPVLRTESFKEALSQSLSDGSIFNIYQYLQVTTPEEVKLSTSSTICLLILWERSLSFSELFKKWFQISRINEITDEVIKAQDAQHEFSEILIYLEVRMFIMFELV